MVNRIVEIRPRCAVADLDFVSLGGAIERVLELDEGVPMDQHSRRGGFSFASHSKCVRSGKQQPEPEIGWEG